MRTLILEDQELDQGRSAIRVEGELDRAVIDQLQRSLDRAADRDQVIVDLSACEFIDSSAIAVLLRTQRRRSADGKDLVAFGAAGQVRRVLEVTGLQRSGLLYERAEEIRSRSPENA